MIKAQLGAQRYNDRMTRIMEDARQLERERLQRGEMPNPSLTSPEEALKYGWEINGREVKALEKHRYFAIVVRVPEPMATEKLGSVYSASTTLGELFREQVEQAGLNSFPIGTAVTRSIEITKDEAINGIR
jgi:hypothetical protein